MNPTIKLPIYILDTSALLSGKAINIKDAQLVTTPNVSKEIRPGGRDYQAFQFLVEKGLTIRSPSQISTDKITSISIETGDYSRLSSTDREILALALDINTKKDKEAIIITDDYSIQNVAHVLHIRFENISQKKITKRFKWSRLCLGCGKQFDHHIKICPMCGTKTKTTISNKTNIKQR